MKRLAVALLAAALVAMSIPVNAAEEDFAVQGEYRDNGTCVYWEPPTDANGDPNPDHDPADYTCLGDRVIDNEVAVLSNAVGSTLAFSGITAQGTPLTLYHLTEAGTGAGANNVDGVYFDIPPKITKMDIIADCYQEVRDVDDTLCQTQDIPATGALFADGQDVQVPDIDVIFFDQAGNLVEDDDGAIACATSGDEANCVIPPSARSGYIFLFAGAPTLISAIVTEIPAENEEFGPCDLSRDFDAETDALDVSPPAGETTRNNGSMFQTQQWNQLMPLCNNQPLNSWCQENGWPSRATPGPWGPPAEGDSQVPSQCSSHPCFGAEENRKLDETDACYDPHYEAPVPEAPEDPLDSVQDTIDNIGDIDPVEVAEDEAHWALNGTAVRWVREFTPARCSETAETAAYGCDEYWQTEQ